MAVEELATVPMVLVQVSPKTLSDRGVDVDEYDH